MDGACALAQQRLSPFNGEEAIAESRHLICCIRMTLQIQGTTDLPLNLTKFTGTDRSKLNRNRHFPAFGFFKFSSIILSSMDHGAEEN